MFDLFRSRDKAVRAVLTVLLGLVALSMVTYLIPGSGGGYPSGDGTNQGVVAVIGKDQLTAQEVSKIVQNMTRSRQLPPALLSIYVPQIVQQMITERAMAYEAGRLGMKISDNETDNAILDTMPPEYVKNGKIDANTLAAILQQEGVTMNDLKDDTARQLLVNRLREIVSQGVVISPREIENEFHRKNDKVEIAYALLTPGKYQTDAEPTDAEMKAYYDAHKTSFQTPEKRSLGIVLLDPARIAGTIQPSDAELQKQYNADLDKYRTPERVNVRHILIKSDASNDAQMKAKAESILKQLQAGGDFAKLAKENSQDPGSADKGGELGWIVKGQTVPEFEKAAFTLKPGETSGLIKTVYGYHIIQLEQHEQAHLQPFSEVKDQILAEVSQRKANDEIEKLSDKVVAELRKDPLHPEKAAASVGVPPITATNLQAGDPIPGLGVSKEFSDAISTLRKGEVTPGPVVLTGNKVALASVTDYQPAHQASLDEAKAEVRNAASQEKLQKILTQKAGELFAKAQSMGGDLTKAAKEMGLEVKTSPDVNRDGTIENVGTASSLPDAFTKPVGSLFGPVSVAGGRLVGKVMADFPASSADLASKTASIRDELRQQKARDRMTLFEEGLKKRLENEGKLKIHQDVIAHIVQTYSGRS